MQQKEKKVLIICDFIFEGGSEKVVDTIAKKYPKADIITTIYSPDDIKKYPNLYQALQEGRFKSSVLQPFLPGLMQTLKNFIGYYDVYWLYFIAAYFQSTNQKYDKIIISTCAHSKLINIKHLPTDRAMVYYHTPTRYLYNGLINREDLNLSVVKHAIFDCINFFLKPLDLIGIKRMNRLNPIVFSNSSYTKENVEEFYHQKSTVLFPPINFEKINHKDLCRDNKLLSNNYFLYHGRIVFQKRVDIAIEACLLTRKSLVISGICKDVNLMQKLEKLINKYTSQDKSLQGLIKFVGRTSNQELEELFANCSALLFPPQEDFGMVPIEAMSYGVPVLAYNKGGSLDYISPGINGYFFEQQTAESLSKLLQVADLGKLDSAKIISSLLDCGEDSFIV